MKNLYIHIIPHESGLFQWKAGQPRASLMKWKTLHPLSREACCSTAGILWQNYSSPCPKEVDSEFLKDPKPLRNPYCLHLSSVSSPLHQVWRVASSWEKSLIHFSFTAALKIRRKWHFKYRLKWQPTPVFLPGGSQGWRSLVGCHLWGCTESDMTEVT